MGVLNPDQFGMAGDGAYSPGFRFSQYDDLSTAAGAPQIPFSSDPKSPKRAPGVFRSMADWKNVNPRMMGRADYVAQGDPVTKVANERGRTQIGTNNLWNNRQVMN